MKAYRLSCNTLTIIIPKKYYNSKNDLCFSEPYLQILEINET